MNKLYDQELKPIACLIGIFVLILGFFNLTLGFIPVLSTYSLAITGILAFCITFGCHSLKDIFHKPVKPIKNFFLYYGISALASLVTAFIMIYVLKIKLAGNPLTDDVPWLYLPFMLLGEELFSFYIFLVAASLLKNQKHQLLIASIICSLIFASVHIPTYWAGSMVGAILHVILLQGVSRLIFNFAGIKSNSMIVPYFIHVIFDIGFFLLVTLSH